MKKSFKKEFFKMLQTTKKRKRQKLSQKATTNKITF